MAIKKEKISPQNATTDILDLPDTYKKFLNSIHDMVLVKGPESKILWANEAFAKFYGMSPEQLRHIVDAPFSEPDHTLQYIKDDQYVFKTGQVLLIPEEPASRYDGKIFWFETVKSPLQDSSGKTVMTIGVSRDITEKRIQDQMLIEQQRLLLVGAAKMATLGEMAGGLAHEINNPLAVIQMITEQISDLVDEEPIEKAALQECVAKINQALERTHSIISSVTSFARSDRKEGTTSFKVKELIEDALSFCRFKLKGKEVKITLEIPDELFIHGVQSEMSQVFVNLINNAVDAIATLPQKWIELSCTSSGEQIQIRLTDSGAGIPDTIRNSLFHQSLTTKPVGKGTGLGLIICKKIIERHLGQIFVDPSSSNTSFVVQLPNKKVG